MTQSNSSKTQPMHQKTVLDQFTRQCEAYATAPEIAKAETLDLLVALSGAGPQDAVLDVACGPGHVACAFAHVVREATGIDLTPAMIEQAAALQRKQDLRNVNWHTGDVLRLPFADACYSIVTARYAFHHLENPRAVLAEMKRVCAPGGRVVLTDMHASPDLRQAAAFNQMERMRDPSHVRAMPLTELRSLVADAGLRSSRAAFYSLEFEVEQVLQASAPNPGDDAKVRQMFLEELDTPRMGIKVQRRGAALHFWYPIVVLIAETPGIPGTPGAGAATGAETR